MRRRPVETRGLSEVTRVTVDAVLFPGSKKGGVRAVHEYGGPQESSLRGTVHSHLL